MIELKQDGARLYIVGNTYAVKDRLKSELGLTGKNFDSERKCWWVGLAKRADAEKLLAALNAPEPAAAPGNAPTQSAEKPAEDPDTIKLIGKAVYKGRNYYVRWVGDTAHGHSAKLISLDGKVEFWAQCARMGDDCDGSGEVAVSVKHYEPRTSGYGRYQRKEHQTLGSIQRFIAKQKSAEASGQPACAACGKRGHLIEDNEDGLMKCRGCCDIPSE